MVYLLMTSSIIPTCTNISTHPHHGTRFFVSVPVIFLSMLFLIFEPCTIPSSFTTTLFWPAQVLEQAAAIDPRVKKITESNKNRLASQYLLFASSLMQTHQRYFPVALFSFENYVWAATACSSRNWESVAGGKKSFIMAPLLDLLNHQFPSNHVSVDHVSRTVSVVVGPDGVKEGSEVMLSYGAKCNPMLLATYGFAVTQNSVECNL
jgi:hypothetical protein